MGLRSNRGQYKPHSLPEGQLHHVSALASAKTGVVCRGAEIEGVLADLAALCGKGEGGRLEETPVDVGRQVRLSLVAKVEEVFLTLVGFGIGEYIVWGGVKQTEILRRVEAGNVVGLVETLEGAVGGYAAVGHTVWRVVWNIPQLWPYWGRSILIVEHCESLVVEVGIRRPSVAGGVDLQSLGSDPVVAGRVLVGLHDKVVALGSVDDDVVQVGYWLNEKAVCSYESQLVAVYREPV